MDLVYEQTGVKADSQETLTSPKAEDSKTNEINRKTEESFEKLEDEISKTYNLVESKATGWGSSFSSFLNNNLHLDKYINETKKSLEELKLNDKLNEAKTKLNENVKNINENVQAINKNLKTDQIIKDFSSKTTQYLDDLDKELEQVENVTGDYFNKFTNIIKSSIVVDAADQDLNGDEELNNDESDLLFNVGSRKITSNRTEAQYNLLNSNKDLYLKNDAKAEPFVKFEKDFSIDSKTDEISVKLQNAQLQKLFNELVPEHINYSTFWSIYFYHVTQIQQREENRKQLLQKDATAASEEENLNWDDEDDEMIESSKESTKPKSSSDGSYELNSVDSSTLEVNKSSKKQESDEEDEDDDWE